MTTPTSSIASVPVTIPSPPPSAAQGGVAPSIWFNTPPLIVGVVMAGQLDMVLVGIIWEHVSVCTTVVSDGVHTSLTRTVVGRQGSHDGGVGGVIAGHVQPPMS